MGVLPILQECPLSPEARKWVIFYAIFSFRGGVSLVCFHSTYSLTNQGCFPLRYVKKLQRLSVGGRAFHLIEYHLVWGNVQMCKFLECLYLSLVSVSLSHCVSPCVVLLFSITTGSDVCEWQTERLLWPGWFHPSNCGIITPAMMTTLTTMTTMTTLTTMIVMTTLRRMTTIRMTTMAKMTIAWGSTFNVT